ncbi:MAG: acyloxyacyl hydrolase [Alphaproteobacteria bacterium]
MKSLLLAVLAGLLVWASWSEEAVAAEPERVSFSVGSVDVLADGPSFLDFGIGVFDVNGEGNDQRSAAAQIEYRFGQKLFFVGPAIGIMANTDGGVFGYGGFYGDLAYQNFVATPVLALGGYKQGGSKDLGGIFQFRVGLGLMYRFEDGSRLGLRVNHISNASIHEENRGEEEILLTYSLPF